MHEEEEEEEKEEDYEFNKITMMTQPGSSREITQTNNE